MDCCKLMIIFLFVFISIATALDDSKVATILKYEFTHDEPSSYFYQYENSDGQTKEEKGEHADSSDFVVRGSYSYLGADGIQYTVTYVADKDGYHPTGDHINVPPYTPWPVNRILGDDVDDGHYKPEETYLPSSEKPPVISPQLDNFATSIQTKKHNLPSDTSKQVPSTTPQPPLPSVTNTYIPSTPSVVVQGHSGQDEDKVSVRVGAYSNDRNPVTFSSLPSTAYIPSTPSPRVNSVTVTPFNHVAAASTAVPVKQTDGVKSRRGRARNLAAYRKAQSDLFEVIQNNHSSQGVFEKNK